MLEKVYIKIFKNHCFLGAYFYSEVIKQLLVKVKFENLLPIFDQVLINLKFVLKIITRGTKFCFAFLSWVGNI